MPGARPPEERFWEKVRKGGSDECWLWTASTTGFGYGKLTVSGRLVGAHCFSFVLHKGPIPDGKWVLHKCDTPACVNPQHLFAGTRRDNVEDMDRKGRRRNRVSRGEANPSARLKEVEVVEIKRALRNGAAREDLAERFKVSVHLIRGIGKGRIWAHVP